uniref:AMP-binding enzyme C-terminal domain-containing protein n=1 Tax=Phlebotomus papatasi TaxID=29031 RepID=A0A1B0DIS0_PHLPP
MKGYIGNDAATKEVFDPEGWLRTGDLGYYDEDEFFFIVDRIKEVIKYRALQVPPAELEALLLSHPKIADAGVTGIPNEADGEHPIAFVVKKPSEEITEQEIKDYIANLVIDIKRLRGGIRQQTRPHTEKLSSLQQ